MTAANYRSEMEGGDLVARFFRTFRRNSAESTVNEMLERTGIDFNGHQGGGALKSLSAENIRNLIRKIGSLTEEEHAFTLNFLSNKLYATHATSANLISNSGVATINSRRALQSRNVQFDERHSAEGDIDQLATNDYVFFSLESGASPQKQSSRFGNNLFRFGIKDNWDLQK